MLYLYYCTDQCITCKINTADANTRCQHKYCRKCLDKSLQTSPYCPLCKVPLQQFGDQPSGCKMTHQILKDRHNQIPGYEHYGTIKIQYFIPNGIQGRTHPHPGRQFIGNTFHAYLPDSKEGRQVLDLLMKAFNAKIIFTIGKNDRVVWNDIHHKTNLQGGFAK